MNSPETATEVQEYSVLLGMMEINQRMHLVVGETVSLVCILEGESVFELKRPTFLDLGGSGQLDQQYQQSEQSKDTQYQV